MKRILLSTVTLGLIAGAVSCANLDEKLITGVSSQYYSTPDGLNSAVIASYAQLRGYYVLTYHRCSRPTPRLLRPRTADIVTAGRHRYLDGRRPIRIEQQGFRFVRRRIRFACLAISQHIDTGLSID